MTKSPFGKRGRSAESIFRKVFGVLYYVFAACCLWVAITCLIQRFKNPAMTETQIFLNIPNSVVLNFNEGVEK